MTFKTRNSPTACGAIVASQFNTVLGVLVVVLHLAISATVHAEDATNTSTIYAESEFQAKQKAYETSRTNSDLACQFARACFDRAEFATSDTQRAELAQLGIKAAREVLRHEPKNMQAHYNLGLNLGQLARTKSLGALSIVDEMEKEFTAARAMDEKYDFAGPDRTLGMLYYEAPSTISIGNRSKAKTHLQRAVELAPEFPENRLSLAEARLQWRDRDGARKELDALDAGLTKARAQFTGDAWAAAWFDWDQRLQKLRTQLKAPVKPVVTSPKGATK